MPSNTPVPLRRYIFNTLTVVSLMLTMGTVGLWVDSYWHRVHFGYHDSHDQTYGLGSKSGIVRLGISDLYEISRLLSSTTPYTPDDGEWLWSRAAFGPDDNFYPKLNKTFLGFGYYWGRDVTGFGSPDSYYVVEVPNWFLTLIFAVLPAIWLFKWNKRRKLGLNACPACGYDLTANETGKCPECGAAVRHKKVPSSQ